MIFNTVTISVVTYNNERYIGKLLDNIYSNVHDVDFHIYVIDNNSTDHTIQIVKEKKRDNLTLIENKSNIGFGRAHNQVLNLLKSKYHIIINPDIILSDHVISALVHYCDEHGDIGIVTPKVLYPDGTLQILPKRDPKFRYLVARRVNIPFLRKYREEFEMKDRDPETVFDIEFCTGSFMFMRTEIFKRVGGFDDRYFLYFEDADLSREFRNYTRTQYNPNFVVYHHWERAGAKHAKYFFIHLVSMFKYMNKWRSKKSMNTEHTA
ncbi:MAG: glycosyltransferase family 2 protein [Christensenellales bacterium]